MNLPFGQLFRYLGEYLIVLQKIKFFTMSLRIILLFGLLISGTAFGQELDHLWSATVGNPVANENQGPTGLVVDNDGNKYICGKFEGTHDFDPGPGVAEPIAAGENVYIMKLDSNNNLLWVNSYGTTGSQLVNYGLVVDDLGGVYTYGYFEGSLFYDLQNSLSTSVASTWWYTDCYVHKLAPDGQFEWIKTWTSNDGDGIIKMLRDNDGNFYMHGFFGTSLDMIPGSGVSIITDPNGYGKFLAKYNANFQLIWAKQYEGTGSLFIRDIHLNSDAELTIVGDYDGIIDFNLNAGLDNDTAFVNDDMFTHVIDTSGMTLWRHTIKDSGVERNGKIVEDQNGNRYVSGTYNSDVDFNPGGPPNILESYGTDGHLLKFDDAGVLQWAKPVHGEGSNGVGLLFMDGNELIIANSSFYNLDLEIDPSPSVIYINGPGNATIAYLMKLDGDANVLWHQPLESSGTINFFGLDFDQNGDLFIVGQLNGSVDMDPGPGVAQLSHNFGSTTLFVGYHEDPCAPLASNLSNYTDASCNAAGEVNAVGINGIPPYSFNWLTNPPISGSAIISDTAGLFFVEVEDAVGCLDTNAIYLEGPSTNAGFDLDVNMISSNFIQGQSAMIWLDAYNGSCQNASGQLQLVLDSLIQYDSATVVPNTIIGDTLIWNFTDWNYDSTHFMPIIFVTTSQNAVTGDTVCFAMEITPFAGDVDTTNNVKNYCVPVLASYDPNDKKVYPIGICDDHVYMDQELTYTVRFQNTGNFEALHVNIIDTIDTSLDLTTFELLGQSHPNLEVNYMGDNELQFNFQNIHLPDSMSDPVGSCGYVIFKIIPKQGIAFNTIARNKVHIFFDFNEPIITNTVTTTFTNDIPCVTTDDVGLFELDEVMYMVYPNPTQSQVTFRINDHKKHSLKLVSSIGTTILETELVNGSVVQMSDLPSGLYYFLIDERHFVKLMKQ